MLTFECLMLDDRSAEPQLSWLLVRDLDRARVLAQRDLLKNPHHRAVQLREKGVVVFSVTRAELETPAPADRPIERRTFRRDPA